MSQHRSQGFLASSRVLGAEQAACSSHGCHSGHSVQQTTSTVLGHGWGARAPPAAPKSSPCSRFGDVLQGHAEPGTSSTNPAPNGVWLTHCNL